MRNWFKTVMGFLAALFIAGAFSSSVFGVASFARQTGLECTSCHASAPGWPALNSFGQAFKAGGYIMGNDDRMIGDGEQLSLPVALNFSIVLKTRLTYSTTPNVSGSDPVVEVDVPDEFALFFAGRVGKYVGFVTEYNADGPVSFKMPFVVDVGPAKLGIVPHWTDAAGPGWMFENLSTGQVKNIRPTENQGGTAFKSTGYTYGAAAGLGFYVWHPMAFFVYTPFVPGANVAGATQAQAAHYVRGAVTPTFGGLETGIGFSYITGTGSAYLFDDDGVDGGGSATYGSYSVDAQVMGDVGLPISAFVTYSGDLDPYELDYTSAYLNVYVEAGLLPDMVNFGLGYTQELTDAPDPREAISSFNAVAKVYLLMNLRLQFELIYTLNDGAGDAGDMKFQSMLFGSF